jgi:hypothetical protein
MLSLPSVIAELQLLLCRVSWKGSKKKKKSKREGVDMYALLGLQNERWTATEKQIKDGEYL